MTGRRFVFLLVAILAICVLPASAFAATSGPRYGTGTSVNSPAAGDLAWATPANVDAVDTNYATCTDISSQGGMSYYLLVKDFGFAIPDGATIDGIQVEISRHSSGGQSPLIRDAVVRLTKDGSTLVGNNLAVTGTDWPRATLATQSYGGASALWGATWGVEDVNSADFGVALQVQNANTTRAKTATVDFIRITVSFTPAPVQLTVTATADDKVYDGTTAATVLLSSSGVAPGDAVTFGHASAVFETAEAGEDKTVSVAGITLAGADAGKYTLANTTTSATADITAKPLTVSGATAADKTYDGDDDATVDFTAAALVGVIGDDDVTLDASAAPTPATTA